MMKNLKFRVEQGNVLSCGCLQGYLYSPYCKMTERLGLPRRFTDIKWRAEWIVRFNDGTCVAIYDWKEDQPLEQVTRWHIGGFSAEAVELVGYIMDQPTKVIENTSHHFDDDYFSDL